MINKTMREIIFNELAIWKTAYPKEAKALELFANKIYFELEFRYSNEETKEITAIRKDINKLRRGYGK